MRCFWILALLTMWISAWEGMHTRPRLTADPVCALRLSRLQKRLDTGALTKFRLDSTGMLSALYETELKPQHKIAVSGQFDATDLGKAPKVGFALDIKN